MLSGARPAKFAISGDHVGGYQVVNAHPMLAHEPPYTTAEGQTMGVDDTEGKKLSEKFISIVNEHSA
jgi:hypothetical protein